MKLGESDCLTKYHENWTKIVDFLPIVNSWACLVFSYSDLMYLRHKFSSPLKYLFFSILVYLKYDLWKITIWPTRSMSYKKRVIRNTCNTGFCWSILHISSLSDFFLIVALKLTLKFAILQSNKWKIVESLKKNEIMSKIIENDQENLPKLSESLAK